MGLIKQTEQDNGNILLEILYGGKEAPFGGVDTSAPPAYIDPRCFTSSNGFLIVDNKLVVTSWVKQVTPTLWGGVSGVDLLKFGTFYNSINGQLNYALGYKAVPFNGPPSGVSYVFYMTAWNPSNPTVPLNDTLTLTIFDAVNVLEQASITLDSIASGQSATAAGSGASGTVTINGVGQLQTWTVASGSGGSGYANGNITQIIQGSNITGWLLITGVSGGAITTGTIFNQGANYVAGAVTIGSVETSSDCILKIVGPGGTFSYTIPSWSTTAYTRQQIVGAMCGQINGNATPPYLPPGVGANPDVTAQPSIDGFSIIITANVAGTGGNTITVQDLSVNQTSTLAPPFYFSNTVARNLEGGQVTQSAIAPRSFTVPASTAEVGGTLYIANLGPMILKYSGPGEFTTSTMYNGVGVIRKFAGSLIGLRLENQLGVFTQNQDMIFAWSATENLDVWSPVTAAGLVTGAGFEQIADIGDYLTGLVVSNGTAFIIRAQGLSYATPTGNATLPYAISHVGLGDRGEGAQVSDLVCQYDQIGAFVGNADIFQISGSVSSIGQKIKAVLFSLLQDTETVFKSASLCSISVGGDTFPLLMFVIGNTVSVTYFVFNTSNGTWMMFTTQLTNLDSIAAGVLSNLNSTASDDEYNLSFMSIAIQQMSQVPAFYSLIDRLGNTNSISLGSTITFPAEEISFGHDITVDGLFVSLWAEVIENVMIEFHISVQKNITTTPGAPAVYVPVSALYATYVLTPAVFFTLTGNPIEIQLFPNSSYGAGAITGHSPQLEINIPPLVDTGIVFISIAKVAMFASFDPNQRPM